MNVREVLAALKSGQDEKKGFNDMYFADHDYLFDDNEILIIVAKKYPAILGHLSHGRMNDEAFVIRWLTATSDPDKVAYWYQYARKNVLRVRLSAEQLESIKDSITPKSGK